MERGVFPKPEVRDRLEQFVRVRLWVSGRAGSERWKTMLRERFDSQFIPVYAVTAPDDTILGKITFPGGGADAYVPVMADFLDRMLEAHAAR